MKIPQNLFKRKWLPFRFMKRIFIYLFLIIFSISAGVISCYSEDKPTLLRASVSMVPTSFFGTWRVTSKLVETDSPVTFKQSGLDLWNLSRTNDVITLSNPFNGANAEITINSVNNNCVVFKKNGKYDNKILTDTVEIRLNGEEFKGFDYIRLDTRSDVNGKIIKTETAKYSITGEKIAGQSVIGN